MSQSSSLLSSAGPALEHLLLESESAVAFYNRTVEIEGQRVDGRLLA